MKIIKDGKPNQVAFKFKCDNCGCKFEADVSDYVYVKFDVDNFGHRPTENNIPSDEIMCRCPNCNKKIVKNIYKKEILSNNENLGYVIMTAMSIVVAILIPCVFTGNEEWMTDAQIFTAVFSAIYALFNTAIYIIKWVNSYL